MAAGHKGPPRGKVKTGGRKKGTPSRKSLDFKTRLDELGIDLIEEIMVFIKDSSDDAPSKAQKMSCLSQMLNYVYPTRKALSLSPEEEKYLQDLHKFMQMTEKDLKNAVVRIASPSFSTERENKAA
jgi:hypothetical protein